MAYLWEDYNLKNEYLLATKSFCPYTEIFETVNNVSRVNILYRFTKIRDSLSDYFESEEKLKREIGDKGFNTLFHVLANIDFYAGLSEKDFRMMKIYEEVCDGLYGVDVALFKKMTFEHRYKILSYMILRKENRNRKNLFFDCITELFDVSLNYSEFEDIYILQLWCNPDKVYGTDGGYTAKQLYDLAKEMLCDFWINVEDYWKNPIGILMDENCIDEIQII